jgi:hypothetical protein
MPICNDCKMVSEIGVVCSQACLDAIKAFQERVKDDGPSAKRPLIRRETIKKLVVVVVLLGIAYAILCYRSGEILSPSDVLDQLTSWAGLFRAIF